MKGKNRLHWALVSYMFCKKMQEHPKEYLDYQRRIAEKILKEEFKPNTSPSLYISELYGDTNNTINLKSEYNIFLSLSESFYLWEDNLYQSYFD